jgi:hypothetical protein
MFPVLLQKDLQRRSMMSEWYIENGSYPYLSEVLAVPPAMQPPYPAVIWCTDGSRYPEMALKPERVALGCFANAERLKILRFQGTSAQWAAVETGDDWHIHAAVSTVQCKDDTVVL